MILAFIVLVLKGLTSSWEPWLSSQIHSPALYQVGSEGTHTQNSCTKPGTPWPLLSSKSGYSPTWQSIYIRKYGLIRLVNFILNNPVILSNFIISMSHLERQSLLGLCSLQYILGREHDSPKTLDLPI